MIKTVFYISYRNQSEAHLIESEAPQTESEAP